VQLPPERPFFPFLNLQIAFCTLHLKDIARDLTGMLTIIPKGREILQQVGNLDVTLRPLIDSLVPDEQLPPAGERPFVQLAHSEIDQQDLESALGYAGIDQANAPIGLPIAMEPLAIGKSLLLFSLDDLEKHLRDQFDEVLSEAERAGGFPAFLDSRDVEAIEYLVVGLVECIRWCKDRRAALQIRW